MRLSKSEKATMFSAGVWEQQGGFVLVSRHKTFGAAMTRAKKYARMSKATTGGTLSWAGGVKDHQSGRVQWVDSAGKTIGYTSSSGNWING